MTNLTEGRRIKKKVKYFGMDISLEVLAGQQRTGTSKSGQKWSQECSANYGYFLKTNSPDGENLDVWLKDGYDPKKPQRRVYVIHQLTPDGSKYDEDKVMMGYPSKESAIADFKKHSYKPNKMFGGMSEFDIEHFQVIAFQAKNSTAMLATQKMYDHFKEKGYLQSYIKSPIQVSQLVSESYNRIIQLSKINIPLFETVVDASYMTVIYSLFRTTLKYPERDIAEIIKAVATKYQYSEDFLVEILEETYGLEIQALQRRILEVFDYETIDRPMFDVWTSNIKNLSFDYAFSCDNIFGESKEIVVTEDAQYTNEDFKDLNEMSPRLIDPVNFGLDNNEKNKSFAQEVINKHNKIIEDNSSYAIYQKGDKGNGYIVQIAKRDNLIHYAVKYKYKAGANRLVGATVTQVAVWKKKNGLGGGLAARIFFDYFLKNYPAIMSDSEQTPDGQSFWISRMTEAYGKGYKIALMNMSKNLIIWFDPKTTTLDQWLEDNDGWSSDRSGEYNRYVISN